MTKQQQLDAVVKEIEQCTICQKDSIGVAVPGEGSAEAIVMFVGEAPGKTEAKTGRPFVGRSGKLLRKQIQEIGLKEEDIYITSPVKYLPKRGTPSKEQIMHAQTHFLKQVDIIKPKVMVLMGKVAALGALNREVAVSKQHGQMINENGRIYFFMYHPAAAIRFNKFLRTFQEDFQKLKVVIDKL